MRDDGAVRVRRTDQIRRSQALREVLGKPYEAFLTVCWGPDGHEPCTRDGKKHDLRRSSSVLSGWESE